MAFVADGIRIDGSQEEDKDCMICAYTLPRLAFPSPTIAPSCTHEVSTCLSCLAKSIRHDLENRMWDKIQCPECRALLDHYSVRKYADEETFARYAEQVGLEVFLLIIDQGTSHLAFEQ